MPSLEVWTWNTTKLAGPERVVFPLPLRHRRRPALAERETAELAQHLFSEAFAPRHRTRFADRSGRARRRQELQQAVALRRQRIQRQAVQYLKYQPP
jgi:hypothetical protein